MAFAIVIQCYNQSKCRVFDIEEGNGLSDSLDLARTLLLENRWHGVCMTPPKYMM